MECERRKTMSFHRTVYTFLYAGMKRFVCVCVCVCVSTHSKTHGHDTCTCTHSCFCAIHHSAFFFSYLMKNREITRFDGLDCVVCVCVCVCVMFMCRSIV